MSKGVVWYFYFALLKQFFSILQLCYVLNLLQFTAAGWLSDINIASCIRCGINIADHLSE